MSEQQAYSAPERKLSFVARLTNNLWPMIKGRSFARRAKGHIGAGLRLRGELVANVQGIVKLGNHNTFWSTVAPINLSVRPNAMFRTGDNVYFNYGVDIGCYHSITIGNNVLVGPMTNILDDPQHELEPGVVIEKFDIVIEDNVWIARGCIIQPGVTIGKNSVVAAGAVVTNDIPPNCLAGGVPARVIRELNIPDGWVRH